MSQGAPGASLPRFSRRLLLAGLGLDAAELICCGLPLVLWMQDSARDFVWLKVALPLTLALWAAAALRMAYLVRPVLDIVAALREGGKPKPTEAETARLALLRAPREIAVVHLLGWALVVSALPAHAIAVGARDPLSGVALIQLVLVTSAGLAAVRILAVETILAPTRAILVPNLQGIRVFADRYRGALLAVGVALLGLWQTALAFFCTMLGGATGEVLVSGVLVLWPVLLPGGYLWWRRVLARTQPIEDYFDAALRTKGGKGLGRDDPKAVAAFVAAERTPYALGAVQALLLVAGGGAAVVHLGLGGHVALALAGRLLLIVLLVSLLATFYQTLLCQQVLRPLIRHLGSRHALPLAEVRAPLGLSAKLGASLLALLVAACAFVWLFVHARSAWGPLSLAVATVAVFGVVLLLVRDVVSPLRALEERSGEMAQGQLARPVPPWGEADEIGRLAVMFEEMRRSLRDRLRSTESINVDLEREVRRRTEALEQRNAELHEALEKLRRAQDNLVRTEKLASMGRLVAGIAHEINNPVNAVINSLGPLEEAVKKIAAGDGGSAATLGREAEEILAVVQRGAARTKAIVQALHGYARGDDSTQRLVDLARSLDDTLGLLQHRLRHVQVVKDIEPGVRIAGFPGQIDQVLMNLLTNAAQAIGARGGTITVAAKNQDAQVLLTIADDGPGIPGDVLPHIFDPFFTTKDVGEGSGLGLSIVHGIIERHGGRIDVDSQPGHGTKFSISFPLPPAGGVSRNPQ
ncbi:MAG: HAMP domain-containing protein [Deltaproteobacteria bacterium]|nr:HAMP domain-containing protein [Deltaproteobacteria bacterium]